MCENNYYGKTRALFMPGRKVASRGQLITYASHAEWTGLDLFSSSLHRSLITIRPITFKPLYMSFFPLFASIIAQNPVVQPAGSVTRPGEVASDAFPRPLSPRPAALPTVSGVAGRDHNRFKYPVNNHMLMNKEWNREETLYNGHANIIAIF